jgi:hypothetical protein
MGGAGGGTAATGGGAAGGFFGEHPANRTATVKAVGLTIV